MKKVLKLGALLAVMSNPWVANGQDLEGYGNEWNDVEVIVDDIQDEAHEDQYEEDAPNYKRCSVSIRNKTSYSRINFRYWWRNTWGKKRDATLKKGQCITIHRPCLSMSTLKVRYDYNMDPYFEEWKEDWVDSNVTRAEPSCRNAARYEFKNRKGKKIKLQRK